MSERDRIYNVKGKMMTDNEIEDRRVHLRAMRRAVQPMLAPPIAMPPDDFDNEPTSAHEKVELPSARVKASWWRRLLARFTATKIRPCCMTCNQQVPLLDGGRCFWCTTVGGELQHWSKPIVNEIGASDTLEALSKELRDR